MPATAIRLTLRNRFQLPGAQRVGLTSAEEWAQRIAINRIEHDRDRAKHLRHGGWVPLGQPKYVESGTADDPCGEWLSEGWIPSTDVGRDEFLPALNRVRVSLG